MSYLNVLLVLSMFSHQFYAQPRNSLLNSERTNFDSVRVPESVHNLFATVIKNIMEDLKNTLLGNNLIFSQLKFTETIPASIKKTTIQNYSTTDGIDITNAASNTIMFFDDIESYPPELMTDVTESTTVADYPTTAEKDPILDENDSYLCGFGINAAEPIVILDESDIFSIEMMTVAD